MMSENEYDMIDDFENPDAYYWQADTYEKKLVIIEDIFRAMNSDLERINTILKLYNTLDSESQTVVKSQTKIR